MTTMLESAVDCAQAGSDFLFELQLRVARRADELVGEFQVGLSLKPGDQEQFISRTPSAAAASPAFFLAPCFQGRPSDLFAWLRAEREILGAPDAAYLYGEQVPATG
jgi:hypothetical protein